MMAEEIYNLNEDPSRLWELLAQGHEIICLVNYTLDYGERKITQSDICKASLDRYGIVRFCARGIVYIEFGGRYEQRTFEAMCAENNVRYIDPLY